MKKWICLLLTLLCLLPAALPAMAEGSITCAQEQVTVGVGRAASLKVTVAPASLKKGGVAYQSTDESVATVDRSGKVKGVAEGECQIVITCKQDETVRLEVPVRVIVPAKRITAVLDHSPLHVGDTAQIVCDYSPEHVTLKSAAYASSKESVATVDENGVVTAVGRGQATITVTSADGGAKTRLTVKVNQQPTDVSLNVEDVNLAIGKTAALKATVLPKNASDKKLIWSSSDPKIASVDKKGRVKALAKGEAVITAVCEDNREVSASAVINCIRLAQSVSFAQKEYSVLIGETLTVDPVVLPEETSDKSVTWKSSSPKVASVDENGVITAHRGGKVTITAYTADGSKRRGYFTLRVIVPVTGVHFNRAGMRVGVGMSAHVTAVLEPEGATNHNMTWVSSDTSVATVKGNTNKPRITGRRWGRCQLTGTTEDGGYTATIDVNVGSLNNAITVEDLTIKGGEPSIVLKNRSNMLITSITYQITAKDGKFQPIQLSTKGDTLTGTYGELAPGAQTRHGHFYFIHYRRPENMSSVSLCITGWECADGYYDNDGQLQYSYTIPKDKREWITYDSPLLQ